jgi:hypothetical protein
MTLAKAREFFLTFEDGYTSVKDFIEDLEYIKEETLAVSEALKYISDLHGPVVENANSRAIDAQKTEEALTMLSEEYAEEIVK